MKDLGTYEELHLRYFLIYFLHELNDEVDQLVLQHSFCMEVRDQERDVVSLEQVSDLSSPRPGFHLP